MLHLRIAVVFQPHWMARSDSIRAMYFSVITFLNRRKEAEVKAESLSHQVTELNYQELGVAGRRRDKNKRKTCASFITISDRLLYSIEF